MENVPVKLERSIVYVYITFTNEEDLALVKEKLTYIRIIKPYSRFPIKSKTLLCSRAGERTLVVFKGLLLEVQRILEELRMPFEFIDKDVPLVFHQKNFESAIQGARAYQVEALSALLKNNGGIIWMATNAGKTEIAGSILRAFPDKRFLYLVRNKELLTQTIARFAEKLKMPDIGRLDTSKQEVDKRVVIAMAQTVASRIEALAPALEDFDGIIVDECHHFSGDTMRHIAKVCTGATFKMGMTGTLYANPAQRLSIERFFGPVVYRITNTMLMDAGYSSNVSVIMVKGNWGGTGVSQIVKESVMLERLGHATSMWNEIHKVAFVHNQNRNVAISKLMQVLSAEEGAGVLVFVDQIDHGRVLSELTGIPFISAGSEDRTDVFTKFKTGEVNALISSPILDEGVDTTRIRNIILAGGKKSEIKILQRIGRGLRKGEDKDHLTVYDFFDDEVPMLVRHSNARLELYKGEGFPVEFINIDEV